MADRIVVMNHGVIEQVGTPEEIYARPTSAFVAHFVGTMNFLDATVTGASSVTLDGVTLGCANPIAAPVGSSVRLACRPEEVRVRDLKADAPNQLATRVLLLDFLGAFCRATLELIDRPGVRIIADFSANAVRDLGISVGSALTVALPPEAIRVFPGRPGEAS